VHEITDAVDVSERTFFRYFASKEDLVLSFVRDGAAAFAAALAARPPEEEPLAAARHALQSSILELDDGAGRLAAYLRSVHDHDDEIIEVLARREGVDPVADRRPRVLAAVIGAMVYLANKDWQAGDKENPEDLAAAFEPMPTPSSLP
jgi:AcrR family transcriptional regulator